MRSFIICTHDQMKEGEMGEACNAHGGDEKCVQILVGRREGKNHSEGLGVDERIILKWILGK
jgi:hypothetical protein